MPWFKIYEDGLDSGTWAVDKLIANVGKVSFTIPSCIPAGQYLLRVELIGMWYHAQYRSSLYLISASLALHAASTYPGAQIYVVPCSYAVLTLSLISDLF